MSRLVDQPRFTLSSLFESHFTRRPSQPVGEAVLDGSSRRIDALLADFESHWDRGEDPRAEDFISPSMTDEEALALIYHEYCLREIAGEAPTSSFLARFPDYHNQLERLLSVGALVDLTSIAAPAGGAVDWPAVGNTIGPYRLIRPLGSGAFSRVFLAQQTDLADRLVVIKLSHRSSPEPQLLALARHPHIVEVIRHGSTPDGRLHLVCMPYLGGATLGALLEDLRRPQGGSRHGTRHWLDVLDQHAGDNQGDELSETATRRLLQSLGPQQAIGWMVARLAQALDVAHRRGVLHGDVKPSNILIAADGKPLLLDFNLAIEWRVDGRADIGGTLAYMSPERLRRLSCSEAAEPTSAVPDRAVLRDCDIYSLGLVLVEALTLGPPPAPDPASDEQARSFARRIAELRSNPAYVEQLVTRRGVPRGLRTVLRRCLAPRIDDRYARGSELAEDLDRWVAYRPLLHAAQPGVPQRLRRWSMRHRGRLALSFAVLLVATIAVIVARHLVDLNLRRAAVDKLNALWSGSEPGVCRFEWVGAWRQDDPVETAQIAYRVLKQFDALGPSNWRARPDVQALPPEARFDLELWLLEHTWKYAAALATSNSPEQTRRAASLLERDQHWAALDVFRNELTRLRHESASGRPPGDIDPVLQDYSLGVALEPRHARRAKEQFERVLARHPDSFWANYRVAACACRLGDYALASQRLTRCLSRMPGNAALWSQLAACQIELDRPTEAEQACEQALKLSPDLAEACQVRALLHAQADQGTRLAQDLELFGWLTGRVQALKRWDLMVLLEYAQRRRSRGSVASRESEPQLSGIESEDALAHALRGCLREWDGRWNEAIEEYGQALLANSDHLWALYRRGQVKARTDPRSAFSDYYALVCHDRVEELFGQQPHAMRAYYVVISQRLRDATRAVDVDRRRHLRHEALRLARIAVRQAKDVGQQELVVDMELLLARTLVATAADPGSVSAEVAEHIQGASRYDPVRTHRLLTKDRLFTGDYPPPDWIPRRDPALRFLPGKSRSHRDESGEPNDLRSQPN